MHEGEEVTVRYTVLGNPGNRMFLSATLRIIYTIVKYGSRVTDYGVTSL